MKKTLMMLALSAVVAMAAAQGTATPAETVSINAKGDDVRSVIHDMFGQAHKNFVLSPGVRFVLYLSLDKVDFSQALTIVCKNANLKFEIQNGIYYISNNPPKPVEPKPFEPKPADEKSEPSKAVTPPTPAKVEKKTLPTTVLAKRVTTRFHKVDLREVMESFADQTGVTIEVADDVPAYKLDAFLINTSLKYALDRITEATKLEYRFTDHATIQLSKTALKPLTKNSKSD